MSCCLAVSPSRRLAVLCGGRGKGSESVGWAGVDAGRWVWCWSLALRAKPFAVSAWNGGFACDCLPDGSAQTSYFSALDVGRVRKGNGIIGMSRARSPGIVPLAGQPVGWEEYHRGAQKGPYRLSSRSLSTRELSQDSLKNLRILSMSTDHSQVS
ncbi:hypothetical protein TEQG_00930 [Trichophyton equinum CBS 127.97]|uniref:Uncharacterized protein n=1 Tax=Trichophyton equinum (strain ATCC MYA-4606 / CBS 127.97) TaxID=559882 RepID=F2PJ20_TRIEC|nr:hypothetical protein TEQG_00930 [Trichophyton equinum CBS 127.97]